jgi:CRISPR-associated protein Cas2
VRPLVDILVGYDVDTTTAPGRARLRRMATLCKNYGQRVQFSLFECRVNPAQFETFESELVAVIDPTTDSLRIYTLIGGREQATRRHGKDRYVDFDDPLIL